MDPLEYLHWPASFAKLPLASVEMAARSTRAQLAEAYRLAGLHGDVHTFFCEETGVMRFYVSSLEQLDEIASMSTLLGIGVDLRTLNAAYIETNMKPAEGECLYRIKGRYAKVRLHLEQNDTGQGNEFFVQPVLGSVPPDYVRAIESGVRFRLKYGSLVGFPITGVRVTLLDGAWHEDVSSSDAFTAAARGAMADACHKASMKIMEPIVHLRAIGANGNANELAELLVDAGIGSDSKESSEILIPFAALLNGPVRAHIFPISRSGLGIGYSHHRILPAEVHIDPETYQRVSIPTP